MPFTILTGGSFTSTGAGVRIPLPSSADYFKTWNITQLPLVPATGVVVMAEWFGSKFGAGASGANDGVRYKKANSHNTLGVDLFSDAVDGNSAANGFTYVTVAPTVEPQAANAITAITNANPAVVSQTNTYNNGDVLRIYGTTGMLQIGGMDFQISSASGSGYTLLGLPATAANGFAAAGTAGFTRRISTYNAVEPEFLYVTGISSGTVLTPSLAGQSVVSTSVDPSLHYVVGNKVRFSVPSSFGMVQMDGLTGVITALNVSNSGASNVAAYNMVVNIDSSAFTAFAFPASSGSPTTALFATLAPAGSSTQQNQTTGVYTGYEFSLTPFHTGNFVPYMYLSGGAQSPAGANNDVINWTAYKLET